MQFYAYHGVFEEEQKIGAPFQVELDLFGDFKAAAISDDLFDTVDYGKVYELVEEEMQKPSKLIEHIAYRIIQRIKREYSIVERVRIKLSKIKPPIKGNLNAVSIEIEE